MEEMIKLYYNLNAKQIKQKEDTYEFLANNTMFILEPFYRSQEELEDIYQICQELKRLNIPVHTLILNRDNKILTSIYEHNYILMKPEVLTSKEYNILDMIELSQKLNLTKAKSQLYRNQWGELWSKKIDYFEYQIHELGKEKKVILNSFTYYIGIAENAISYVNNTINKYSTTQTYKTTLSHKRIDFPNYAKNYLKPTSFIFDIDVRDIAEYIKSIFFQNQQDAWIEVKAFLNRKQLNILNAQLFYGRLLYPSYYFDIYEQIMNKEKKEDELLPFIKQSLDYETFLVRIYYEIIKKIPIEPIDWILKNNKIITTH